MRGKTRVLGFTLIELMFVIVIIGIISSVAVVSYSKMATRAKNAVVHENMHSVAIAFGVLVRKGS